MLKRLIKKILSSVGFKVSKIHETSKAPEKLANEPNEFVGFDYAEKGNEAVKIAKDFSMLAAINLFTLYEQAAYCEKKNIPGSFVECGVWKGGAVGIMAKANLDFGTKRRDLHLFDAFDGICPPDAAIDGQKAIEDTKRIIGFEEESQMLGQLESIEGAYDKMGGHGTIDICRNLLENIIKYPPASIHFHKGWFQKTLPVMKDEIESIAILRLDGDWYSSIKVCLDNLYSKVSKGGLIVIDDYGYYEGCTIAVDEFLASKNINTFLSYSRPGCRYFIKQDKGAHE